MYSIYIVEDMAISRAALISMLEDNDHTVTGSSARADKAWLEIKNQEIDLVLLDINLAGDKNGIWLAKKIRANYNIPIVYLTAYGDDKTLKELQETAPNGYLMKPYNTPTLLTTIDIAVRSFKTQQVPIENSNTSHHIFIKKARGQVKIDVCDILYIKSDGNYIELHTNNGIHLLRDKISNFLTNDIAPFFTQVHRRYAVNLKAITEITTSTINVRDVNIPLSATYKKEVYAAFEKIKK